MKDSCIIFTWLAPEQPGFLDFAYRVRSLAQHYRTTLVSPYPLMQAEFSIQGVTHLVLPHRNSRVGWILYLLDCARLIRTHKPACAVLLHSLLAPLVLLASNTPVALYWNEHPSRFTASPPGHPWLKRLLRNFSLHLFFLHAARRAELVMPIGEAHYQELLDIGCRPERVQLMYMGVDASFSQNCRSNQSSTSTAPLQLIYNGTVNQLRGRDVMLEALVLANKVNSIAHLTLVGLNEEQFQYCVDYAQQHGIRDALSLVKRIPGSDIPAMLSKADLGLCFMENLPWWRFNPPTKLFEYLVAGVPVLVSDIRTHTQYVSSGYNGMVCEYDSRSLADAIAHIWIHREALPLLQMNARKSGKQYLWERIEPDFLQAIKMLVHADHRFLRKNNKLITKIASVDKVSKKA